MPIQVNKYEIEVTASPGTVTLPVADPYELYTIVTTGTVTLGGAVDIVSRGTLSEGVTYKFQYTGSITNINALTVMGVAVPFNKPFTADAYYNGTSWEVSFLPDLSQLEVLDKETIVGNVSTVIDWSDNTISTVNSGAEQLLVSLEIPAHYFQIAPDGFRLKVFGSFDGNAANLKSITVKSITGANTRTMFEVSTPLDFTGRFMLDTQFFLEDIGTGAGRPCGVLYGTGVTSNVDIYVPNTTITGYDYINGIQYINIYATEATPSGAQVSIRNAILERIQK